MRSVASGRFAAIRAIVAAMALLFCGSARASYLNWGSTTNNGTAVTTGNVTGNFTAPIGSGNSTTTNYADGNAGAGVYDIGVTVTNNTGLSNPWVTKTPGIGHGNATDALISGGDANSSFQLIVGNETAAGYVQFKLSFLTSAYSLGVSNVSFTIYDVDYSSPQFIDQISSIQGILLNGTVISPSTITTSVDNTYNSTNGTAYGTAVAGDTTGNGNVSISFGSAVISAFSFNWSNAGTGLGQQAISVSGVSYNRIVVPETDTALAAAGCCLFVMLWQFSLRSRRRS